VAVSLLAASPEALSADTTGRFAMLPLAAYGGKRGSRTQSFGADLVKPTQMADSVEEVGR